MKNDLLCLSFLLYVEVSKCEDRQITVYMFRNHVFLVLAGSLEANTKILEVGNKHRREKLNQFKV